MPSWREQLTISRGWYYRPVSKFSCRRSIIKGISATTHHKLGEKFCHPYIWLC